MYSWPRLKVQVLLHAIVQVWQPMQRLMLKTAGNCRRGCRSGKRYAIFRPSCQLWTSGIAVRLLLLHRRLPDAPAGADLLDQLTHILLAARAVDHVRGAVEGVAENGQQTPVLPPLPQVLLDQAAGHLVQ